LRLAGGRPVTTRPAGGRRVDLDEQDKESGVVTTSDISYEVGGTTMIGRLAVPDSAGPRPGVLIAHEGNGLDEFQKERAERFAALGYVAFALDYYGGGRPLEDRQEINSRLDAYFADPTLTRRVARAGLDVLIGQAAVDAARIAAVGYCFGGTLVLELGRSGADLKAIVGFHAGLATSRPEDAANIRGKVLVCIGADDPLVPPEQRLAFEEEMRGAGVDWRLNLYGGAKHSFTNPRSDLLGWPALGYDEATDRRSWRDMTDLFDEVFA
jgi:dienelactone hydrolase